MPGDGTRSLAVVGKELQRVLQTPRLGFKRVYYGDRSKIGNTPCAAVETGEKSSDFAGAPFMLDNVFTVYIMVYITKVGAIEDARFEADEFLDKVEDELHVDKRLNGLVYVGYVRRVEPGLARRGGVLMHAARLTWQGQSKVGI